MTPNKSIVTRKAKLVKTNNLYKAELAKARAEHEEGMAYLRKEVHAGRQPASQLVKAQKRFELEVKAIREKAQSNMTWPEYHASAKGKQWAKKDRRIQAGQKQYKPARNKKAAR